MTDILDLFFSHRVCALDSQLSEARNTSDVIRYLLFKQQRSLIRKKDTDFHT